MNDCSLIYMSNGEIIKSYPYESIYGIRKSNETLDNNWFKSVKYEGISVDPKRNLSDEELLVEFFLNFDFFTTDNETFYSTNSVLKIEKSKTALKSLISD